MKIFRDNEIELKIEKSTRGAQIRGENKGRKGGLTV